MQKVNQLPIGPEWTCDIVHVKGDVLDENGEIRIEELELWRRDPVECIHELIGNPAFKNLLIYTPECVYVDSEGTKCIYNEMWTGDWWWEIQVKLPQGSTIAPVIFMSDKTHLTNFQGCKEAWPVYLTIGNLAKDVRHHPSAHGVVLIGYIPVAKLDCVSSNKCGLAGYQLWHHCMSLLTKPMVEAGKTGMLMETSTKYTLSLLHMWLTFLSSALSHAASRVAVVPHKECGEPLHSVLQDQTDTLKSLDVGRGNDKQKPVSHQSHMAEQSHG